MLLNAALLQLYDGGLATIGSGPHIPMIDTISMIKAIGKADSDKIVDISRFGETHGLVWSVKRRIESQIQTNEQRILAQVGTVTLHTICATAPVYPTDRVA